MKNYLNEVNKHYDHRPSEEQYTLEFNHFLKSMLK